MARSNPQNPGSNLTDAPLQRDALAAYFREGFKRPNDLQIGVEWEKVGVDRLSGKAIPYSGPRGVEAIFTALVAHDGWSAVFSGKHPVALRKGGASITLEPGGQIELSGQKSAALDGNASELYAHLNEIGKVSAPLGIVWLGTGVQPVSALEEIEWVPKERYAIMREALKDKGAATHAMMKQTASIQISIDFTDERDAAEKLRLAMALGPFFSAMYANSPVSDGRLNGFLSRRTAIWLETALDRSGQVEEVYRRDFCFDDYVEYALDVPALFIVRGGRWVALPPMRFRDFLEKGHGDWRATLADWELHLTTIFTDARLKQYIELRTIDCQKTAVGLSAPALVKGLFYDPAARVKAWELTGGLTATERRELTVRAARQALRAPFRGGTVLDVARGLVKAAEEGLGRLAAASPGRADERQYLEPLKALLEEGKCPADLLVERLRGAAAQETVRRIIDAEALTPQERSL